MKTYQKITSLAVVAWAAAHFSPVARAEPSEVAPPQVETPKPLTKHQRLCAMLGLKVGFRYEFQLAGNSDVHYWQIVSLGADGWILAKDSRFPATWVNLSQIIAVTLIPSNPTEERPMKANRTN